MRPPVDTRRSMPKAAIGLLALGPVACQGPQNLSTFTVGPPPEHLNRVPWIELAVDPAGDGNREGSADGASFAFHHDAASDTLWFRLELHDDVDPETPAVSVSIDTDADQGTGIEWYGAHSEFTFEKMLSVGPLEQVGDSVRGYNGVTNSDGVERREWINERQGVLAFYIDSEADAYILGVSRSDISPELNRFGVIGSVGADARWNDDIGDAGYATIDLAVLADCGPAWESVDSRELVGTLLRATGVDQPVWGSYGLGDGSYVLHAGTSPDGDACLGLFTDGTALSFAAVPEEPVLLTPLYGYYFDAGWKDGSDAPMLVRAEQPPSIRSWLEGPGIESAVVMPVTVPDFPMELPAIVKTQLALHEAFHVEVQGPRWWRGTGEWPAWDVQPDRAGVQACYTSTEEVAGSLEEEREALVGLIDRLADDDRAGACEAGERFLSLRADRYRMLDEVHVTREDGTDAGCEEAEALLELEEGTADYASWSMLYNVGQVDRDALLRRYRARQDDVFYLTGAMQLHAVQMMVPDSMLAITRGIATSSGPEEGSIGAVFEDALASYCR